MDLLVLIAKSADVCLKPWSHAVVLIDPSSPEQRDELHVRIETRDAEGHRHPERDLELGLSQWRGDQPDAQLVGPTGRPMLWHGRHPVWMDGNSSQRCTAPQDAGPIESSARRRAVTELMSALVDGCNQQLELHVYDLQIASIVAKGLIIFGCF